MLEASSWVAQHNGAFWGVIGIVAGGLLGYLISLLFYRKQRQPKTLDYLIVSEAPLLNNRPGDIGRGRGLKLMLNGAELSNPWITTIRFINTGKLGVSVDDYSDGINVHLGTAQTLDLSVSGVSEPGLYTEEEYMMSMEPMSEQTIRMRPKLLNPKDWYDITILTQDKIEDLAISSRFKDATRPMQNALSLPRIPSTLS